MCPLCPRCGSTVASEDVTLNEMLARCRPCSALFTLTRVQDGKEGGPAEWRGPAAGPLPERFRLSQANGKLSITWRWFNPAFIILLLFGLPCCALVVAFLLPSDEGPAPWFVYPFMLPFAVLGVGSVYLAIAILINRTRVSAGHDRLTIRHGPLPWVGNLTVTPAEIEGMYCNERLLRSRRPAGRPWIATPVRYQYSICLVTRGSRNWSLVWSLDQKEPALYLLRLLEEYLGSDR